MSAPFAAFGLLGPAHLAELAANARRGHFDIVERRCEPHPHVLCTLGAVEATRRDQDAAFGQPINRLPAVFPASNPQIEPALGVIDTKTCGYQCIPQNLTAVTVTLLLFGLVGVVVKRGDRGVLEWVPASSVPCDGARKPARQ